MVATGLEKTMDPAHTGAGILIHSGDRHSPRHWRSSQHNTTQYVISQFLISVRDLRDLNVSGRVRALLGNNIPYNRLNIIQ